MIKEYQLEILKFLCTDKQGKIHLPRLDNTLFDFEELKVIFNLLFEYFEKWQRLPTKVDMLQHLQEFAKKKDIKGSVVRTLKLSINSVYDKELAANVEKIEADLIKYAQYKMTKKLFTEHAKELKDGDMELFESISDKMLKIVDLPKNLNKQVVGTGFLLADADKPDLVDESVFFPTYLPKLNMLSGGKGWASPELIIFAGEQKIGKTAVVVNLAKNFVLSGLKVFIADAENGKFQWKSRVKQSMLNCKQSEVTSEENKKLYKELVETYKLLGGDMVIEFYPAGTASPRDVENDLDILEDKFGWIPDVIIWDYPDWFVANDKYKRREKRINIQHVYMDIVALNDAKGCFSIGLSQIVKSAVGKVFYDTTDLDEDFAKTKNAHRIFGICQTKQQKKVGETTYPNEEKLGILRIVPIAQRQGSPRGFCMARIDKERSYMEGMTTEEIQQVLKIRPKVEIKNLKDE